MGVRAAAGLDRAYLHRPAEVADVEQAKSAKPVVAHVLGNAFEPAVEPPPDLLHRHDQEIADDRDVALPARAYHGTELPRQASFDQPIDIETVVAAGNHDIVPEGHVGVGKTQQRSAVPFLVVFGVFGVLAVSDTCIFHIFAVFGRFAVPGCIASLLLRALRRQLAWILRVVEAWRFGQRSHEFQVHQHLAGIVEPGRETGARVVGQRDEQCVHPLDFRGLIVGDVRRELEQHRVVR